MEYLSFTCPHCGANLPPRAPTGDVSCDYCGNVFPASKPRAARTQQGALLSYDQLMRIVQEAQAEVERARRGEREAKREARRARGESGRRTRKATGKRRSRRVRWFVAVNVVLVLAVGVGIPFVTGEFDGCTRSIEQIASVTGITERVGWNANGGPPIPVDIGGKQAFVGRTRVYNDNDNLYVEAYDSRTVERIWRIGPLGRYSQAYRTSHFAVLGDRVVVVDPRANVAIHDLESGQRLYHRPLTDRVAYICVPPESGDEPRTRVWLSLRDDRHQFFDVRTGAGQEGRKPSWCLSPKVRARRAKRSKQGRDLAPKVAGFRARRALVDGSAAVAAGVKRPGTAVPLAVGFDPASREVRWQTAVASMDMTSVRTRSAEWDALIGGRYISTYGTGQDFWHLTAIDATTGDRLWGRPAATAAHRGQAERTGRHHRIRVRRADQLARGLRRPDRPADGHGRRRDLRVSGNASPSPAESPRWHRGPGRPIIAAWLSSVNVKRWQPRFSHSTCCTSSSPSW